MTTSTHVSSGCSDHSNAPVREPMDSIPGPFENDTLTELTPMITLRRTILILTLCLSLTATALCADHAKNVIVFLADAGGIPTLSAASLHGYDAPQKLYVQSWPHIALSDTTASSSWVTDSAAGMTAIVTGVKTHNSVISQGPDTVRGKQDGTPLKTILEYAEENGLSTGTITNVSIADATPAA